MRPDSSPKGGGLLCLLFVRGHALPADSGWGLLLTLNSSKQAALTTHALEMAAYQDLSDNILDMNMAIIQDPEVAALMYKVWSNTEELPDLEEFRFSRAAFQRLRHGEMAYFQYERGAID